MLTITYCRKRLGDKAKDLTDEQLEAIRDQLYILAGLSFEYWRKSNSSTKGEESSPLFVGEQPTSAIIPYGITDDK